MLVPGVGESVNRTRLIQDGYYTTAIVTEAGMIILHGGRFSLNRRQSGGVHVEYTVSGTVYHNRIRIRHNRVYVGQEVRIYYDSGNPNNITPVDRDIAIDTFVRSIPAFILSAFIILWGVKCIRKPKQKQADRKRNKAESKHMIYKKGKKRVVCDSATIFVYIQEAIDMDISAYLVILFNGQTHTLGLSSDFELPDGKKSKETGRWANLKFHLDEKEFETFEQFKSESTLNGQFFAHIQGDIEVLEADGELPHYHLIFANHVISN